MVQMHINPDVMRSSATTLRNGKQDITDLLTKLQGEVDSLLGDDFRTQHASVSFGQGYEQLNTSMNSAVGGIDQMAQSLDQMAQSGEEWDTSHAAN